MRLLFHKIDVDVSTNVIIDIFSLYQKTLLSDHWSEVEGSETPLSTVSEKRRTDLLGSIDQKFITVLSNAANASSACSSLNFGSGNLLWCYVVILLVSDLLLL